MPLTPTQADVTANDIVTALTTLAGMSPAQAAASLGYFKIVIEKIYAGILRDATVTAGIPVATTGTAAAQTGTTTATGTLT